jgi:hypothetical protein
MDDKIVKFKRTAKDSEQPDQVPVLVCPYCKGADWGVALDEKTACIDILVCVSEECDGDSYVEVKEGVVGDQVFRLEADLEI